MRAENDTGSGGNNCHFITFDSGWSSDANSPPRMSGLTSDQLAWMKEDQKSAYNNGKTHTFVFTHAPIVGHDGKGTHEDWAQEVHPWGALNLYRIAERDKPFVEWVNGDDNNYIEGIFVEAVFAGHMHENHIFAIDPSIYPYMIDETNMDNPPETSRNSIPFSWATTYIETTTATKNG